MKVPFLSIYTIALTTLATGHAQSTEAVPEARAPSASAFTAAGVASIQGELPNMQRIDTLRRRKVQSDFSSESAEDKKIRRARAQAIKDGFVYAWDGYKKYAYGADEIDVLNKKPKTTRNGWGATLVDALDTLWIMGLKDEFARARDFVAKIDFHNDGGQLAKVFETNIRYVGGLLSAYELSNDSIFLEKAVELMDILMQAFDTPLGLPWQMLNITTGVGSSETAGTYSTNLAEIGTFQMEFFRMSQHTGNATYHEAAQNVITVMLRNNIPGSPGSSYAIPGLYPVGFSMKDGTFTRSSAYWGGGGDSFYEYLAKTWILSDFMLERDRELWSQSVEALRSYAVAESSNNHTFTGFVDGTKFYPSADTFTNFIPGTLALASKIVGSDTYFSLAVDLLEGGYSVFDEMPSTLGAESIQFVRKNVPSDYQALSSQAERNQVDKYGFVLQRPYYVLRPELIESLYYMYRLTGDKIYGDRAWKIWQGIQRNCRVDNGYVGTADVTVDASVTGVKNTIDSTESFFFAETFLYLYLIFADQDTISLDEWVFTTEAHPLSRSIAFDGTF
ncbi:hypothetical protein IW140_002070 [Coemansia sp. RSA 1813]|nr:hypothetical protein EV178_000318 [Coemansia sp. RSA 1646]KAJ1772039.1 hypothetical protein LPJ74_001774 [Coemansia sp. RSA 1843]KAJ2090580.1 hypothetical protein IW138_002588 [Coemansia sp. RSA 986]KAJ2216333.1 hypothetical protein EV179_001358 [Coemansia sp. RSA 487]KAJ2570881.1 hypothetical protein IW140_002070 [Coemansia sp. RSA 1813]